MDEIKKDDRFSHITKDPRFRPVSKTEKKLKIDRRFASMFNDPKFKLKYTVDKRGRPLLKERTTRDDMNKFYHLDENESSSDSSDEENEKQSKKNGKSADDEELDDLLKSDDSDDEKQEDDDNEEDEDKRSSSSEDDEEIPEVDDGVEWNDFDDKCVRSEQVSHRLAVCNMDWDRVRAVDIFVLLNSWKPPEGVIKSVTIYPSEYGLKQMENETKLGPLPGTAKPIATTQENGTDSGHQSDAEEEPDEPELKSDDDDEQPNYNEDDDPETTDPVLRERLRKYQLNRLKYYYAVVECDSVTTASHIYEECDGLEYETSSVRLDLRFIPDSVTFNSSISSHDHCTELPDKSVYKPVLFRNSALTQTKVRCTWDETPLERRRLTKKNYTVEELEQINLDEYLASESEEESSDEDDNNVNEGSDDEKKNDNSVFKIPNVPDDSNKKKSNKSVIRAPSVLSSQDDIDRYRALLLDFDDNVKSDKKSKKKISNFFDKQQSDDEDIHDNSVNDDDDDDDSDIDMEITWQPGLKSKIDEQFQKKNNQKEKKNTKKQDKAKLVKEQIEQEEQEDPTENNRETLELLAVDDDLDNKRNYNLRDMIKSHKQSLKAAKKLKKSQKNSVNTLETKTNDDNFKMNLHDKRFQAVYTQAAFNIDQSDPRFKPTSGTQQLIEEKLKKRKFDHMNSSSRTEPEEDNIVAKLKRKSAKKD